MKNKICLCIISYFIMSGIGAQNPEIIKDIFIGEQNSGATRFSLLNDKVSFLAYDGVNGVELWSTDGTEIGTQMIKNIGPLDESLCESVTGCGDEYIVMNNILYFRASDNLHGAEIWRSDGTEEGTYMVKDINLGVGDCSNSFYMNAQYFAVMNNILYFAADGGGNNIELWRSDGTELGTYLVKDFAEGESSIPQYLTNINGALYFRVKNALGEPELWKTDGTESGSVLLKQMWMRGFDNYRDYFFEYNGYIYFAGNQNDPNDLELWRTDGTPEGTQLFMNLNDFDGSDPHAFHIINDKLLFTADLQIGYRLFISDGTVSGTLQLYDENENEFEPAFYGNLFAYDKLFFQGGNDFNQDGLWITDGTNSGTRFLLSIESGSFSEYHATVVNGNNILFRSYDSDNGCYAIFQSDGTIDGTFQAVQCDVVQHPYDMITYNEKVILNATSDEFGAEAWLYRPNFASTSKENVKNENLKIFPNPATKELTIASNNFSKNTEIVCTDILGKIIFTTTLKSKLQTINIDQLPVGIYFMQFENFTEKFIKE